MLSEGKYFIVSI
jgi:hypothetical protein